MKIVIRAAEPDELKRLGDIERSAGELFREQGLDDVADGSTVAPEFVVSFARFGAVLVAEADGTLAGFALVASYDRHAHLYEVSVSKDFQGEGIGRKLVGAVNEWARSKGFKAVTLSTFSDVPWNAPFYETIGFRQLAAHEWTPAFHVLRAHEEDAGLDIDRRCFMMKDLT
jgi:GNAT superfamily N-acetyltransferase